MRGWRRRGPSRRRVRLRYRSARSGETERTVDPYSLLEREGCWYLFAYCRLREGPRLFRLDRVLGAETLEETFERPPGLESPEAMLGAVANSHPPWEVEVLLETSLERAREMVPTMLASLEETDGGVVLRSTASDLGGEGALRALLPVRGAEAARVAGGSRSTRPRDRRPCGTDPSP